MDTKHALASKTVWVQIAAVLSLLLPSVREWLAGNPVEFVSALAAVNVLVRFVTRDGISIFGPGGPEHGSGGPGGMPLLIVGATAGLLCAALPSCAEYPVSGSVTLRDEESGAKGALAWTAGSKPRTSLRVPFYNDGGNLVGHAELHGGPRVVTATK